MKPITIRIAEQGERFPGSYIIEQDGRICDGLGWDEMLGQIAVVTYPRDRVNRMGGTLYPMETPEEREANDRKRQVRGHSMAEVETAMARDEGATDAD